MTSDNDPELDRLDEAVRAAPAGDTTAQIALWRHVAGLERWFFIARGPADQPQPYAVAADQGSVIGLYSSAARAHEASRALGLTDPEGGAPRLFSVPTPAALDYVAAFGQVGVVGVVLDYPRLGHYIPLPNLGLLKNPVEGAAG